MSKAELLQMMRLLSALESVMIAQCKTPDYLLEQLTDAVTVLEREILRSAKEDREAAPDTLVYRTKDRYLMGCAVCGAGADKTVMGYVCTRSDCPTRVTSGGGA
jgi:hypothetical protein